MWNDTRLWLDLIQPGRVRIDIFDLGGRHVRALDAGLLGSGRHGVHWNGRNDRDAEVANGVYVARFTGGSSSANARVTVLR
jgi:flagellar hook assembly protein FlgD